MSYISVRGEQSTATEILALTNLAALAASGAGQFIRKLTATTFENATPSAGSGFATAALDNLASVAINTSLLPGTDASISLGSTTKEWLNLYMATAGTINFANGNVVITHTSGILTIGTGTLKITTPTNTATSVVTIDGTQSLTNKTYNGNTFTAGTGTLTIAAGKTLTANSSTTIAGTDGKTLTVSNSGTLGGGDAFVLAIAAGKTFTVNQTITLVGTDAQTYTFPTTSATIARTDAGNTFTGASTASAWVLTSPTITTKISPTSDDGAPLGDTTHNFSDLFLASGAVVNYANGDVIMTHTAGILTIGTGTLKITNPTNTATSVVTIDGTQTLTNKSIAIGQITGLAAGVATFLATPSSANLISAVTDETGTGVLVFATSPTFTTSVIGGASFDVFNTTSTTINAFGAATTMAIGGTSTASITHSYSVNATANGNTKTINFGTSGAAGSTTNVNIGSSVAGTTTINSPTLALGTGSITMTGSLAVTGSRVTKGWFTDIETTNMITINGTSLASATVTFTNKRNQPRITSAASYTTDTGTSLDVSTTDIFVVTAQAGALKFNNPGGTPVQGEKLIIRIKDNATARALTYDTQFRALGNALPSTTVLSKTLYMGFIYNSTDTKWDLIAVAQEA